jgi:hypothetical protein
MNSRKLSILAAVAAVMVVWAVMQARHANQPAPASGAATYLIQGLDLDGIARIMIGTGEKAVKLRRQAKGFEVVNKDGYPADAKAVNDLLTNCMDVKTTQLATSNPANHADLGVTEDKARYLVKFYKMSDSNEVLLTGLVVGNSKEGGQGTYVRLVNSNDVYLAMSMPWIRDNPVDYLNQDLVSIKTEDLDSVTVISPKGRYVLRKKADSDSFEMDSVPEGKKLKESDARSVATAVGSLRFDDVKKGPDTTLDFNRQYICKLKDSTLYTFRIAQKDSKTYVTCQAEYTDPNKILMDPTKVDSKEELQKKEAKLMAQERVLKFAALHTSWVYEIPSWKAQSLTKDVNDLLEDIKPAAKAGPAEPNAAAAPAAAAPQPAPAKPAATAEPDSAPAKPASEPNTPAAKAPADANAAAVKP